MDNSIKVVASGKKWIGSGTILTSTVVEELINQSKTSLLITSYVLSDYNIINLIKNALERGITIDLFIYKEILNENILKKIQSMNNEFIGLNLYLSKEEEFIHSKVLISDKTEVLIGSANLTNSGLTTNYELGVLIKNPQIAYEIEKIIKKIGD